MPKICKQKFFSFFFPHWLLLVTCPLVYIGYLWSTTEANWRHKPGFDCTEFYTQAIRADARDDERGRPRPGPISQSRATANSEHLIRVTCFLPVNGIWFWWKWKPEHSQLVFPIRGWSTHFRKNLHCDNRRMPTFQ